MNERLVKFTRQWLRKANSDLQSSKDLLSLSHLDTAIYHCHQCAEKSVKGYLFFYQIAFPKTHDIKELILQAATIDSDFLNWSSVGDYLSPLATEYRYPNELEIIEPSQKEVQEAFKMAYDFYNFVISKLPNETHP